jgi:hypothetical protein
MTRQLTQQEINDLTYKPGGLLDRLQAAFDKGFNAAIKEQNTPVYDGDGNNSYLIGYN